ncbi:MAG: integration host factor subunit alpha [Desulfobacterales bacterium]
MALTKKDLVKSLHQEIGSTLDTCTVIIDAMLDQIKGSLGNGEDVLVSGFGKFCVKQKDARKGRNPANGDHMMLRPRKVVTFKCSGKLRKKLNDG